VLYTEHTIQLKFSFLYKGYHPEWFFWEFVILYRKVAVVCASVFLSTVSITVQALSVLAVLLISLFFQLQVRPFLSVQFNRLELKSILVSAVTIYSGLFYQTDSICECYAAIEVKILLFVVIISSNIYFLMSWTRSIIPMIIDTLRKRFHRANRRVSPPVLEKISANSSLSLSFPDRRISISLAEVSAVQFDRPAGF
jgi:hypothetical protein